MVLSAAVPRKWISQTSSTESVRLPLYARTQKSWNTYGKTGEYGSYSSSLSSVSSFHRSRETSTSSELLSSTPGSMRSKIPERFREREGSRVSDMFPSSNPSTTASPPYPPCTASPPFPPSPTSPPYHSKSTRPSPGSKRYKQDTRDELSPTSPKRGFAHSGSMSLHSQSPSLSILQYKLEAANTRSQASAINPFQAEINTRAHASPINPFKERMKNNEPRVNKADTSERGQEPKMHDQTKYEPDRLQAPSVLSDPGAQPIDLVLRLQAEDQPNTKAFSGDPSDQSGPVVQPRLKKNWDLIREVKCPITEGLVCQGRGEQLRSSILEEKKFSFKNLKLTKAKTVRVGPEQVKLKEVTSSKLFEDRANHILNEMRKQRRSLQLEYVAKVSVPKKVSGWRDKLSRSESMKKEETPSQQYLNKKRNSITKFAGQIKRKLSISRPEGREEKVQNVQDCDKDEDPPCDPPPPRRAMMNPLDFILMKEEYIKKNPPPPKKEFVKERSVDSDSDGGMASVMKSLKKIVKAINPKREFPSDIRKKREEEERKRVEEETTRELERGRLREEISKRARPTTWGSQYSWESRMTKYRGASLTPYNGLATRWTSLQDLRQVEEERRIVGKKAVRERIQNKVLSLISQSHENRIEVNFADCDIKDFSIRGWARIKPDKYKTSGYVPTRECLTILEAVEYRRRDLNDIIAHFSKEGKSKKKTYNVKPVVHGKGDKDSKFSYGVITRGNAPWETVKPINVAVKKKTEMFSSNLQFHIPIRAKILIDDSLSVALTTCPGTVGSTQYCEQHKWENMKGCALFSIVGITQPTLPVASINRLLVVSLPVVEVLGQGQEQKDAQFVLCDRKPQSQLVKDVISYRSVGSLSRISFHYPVTFSRFDVVMLVTRFLRTKKNVKRYKWKREEIIARLVEGVQECRRMSTDEGFLSYGTV